jgi:flagellar motor protein MotB
VLKQLSFAGGRHVLLPESVSVLEDLCSILKEHPSMKIEIQGHVCCTSIEPDGFDVDTHTNNLSVNRAKSVFHYLSVECGIDASRLSYKGFGGSQKITLDESTEALQQINRRVEVKILAE